MLWQIVRFAGIVVILISQIGDSQRNQILRLFHNVQTRGLRKMLNVCDVCRLFLLSVWLLAHLISISTHCTDNNDLFVLFLVCIFVAPSINRHCFPSFIHVHLGCLSNHMWSFWCNLLLGLRNVFHCSEFQLLLLLLLLTICSSRWQVGKQNFDNISVVEHLYYQSISYMPFWSVQRSIESSTCLSMLW